LGPVWKEQPSAHSNRHQKEEAVEVGEEEEEEGEGEADGEGEEEGEEDGGGLELCRPIWYLRRTCRQTVRRVREMSTPEG
jgi:TATA-binding protein-associated factor Taf7